MGGEEFGLEGVVSLVEVSVLASLFAMEGVCPPSVFPGLSPSLSGEMDLLSVLCPR